MIFGCWLLGSFCYDLKIIWELDQVSTMAAEALATCVTRPLSVHTWLEISTYFQSRYPHIFTWLIKFDSFWNRIYIEFRRKLCLNLLAWLTLLLAPGCWQYQFLCSVNCDIKKFIVFTEKEFQLHARYQCCEIIVNINIFSYFPTWLRRTWLTSHTCHNMVLSLLISQLNILPPQEDKWDIAGPSVLIRCQIISDKRMGSSNTRCQEMISTEIYVTVYNCWWESCWFCTYRGYECHHHCIIRFPDARPSAGTAVMKQSHWIAFQVSTTIELFT